MRLRPATATTDPVEAGGAPPSPTPPAPSTPPQPEPASAPIPSIGDGATVSVVVAVTEDARYLGDAIAAIAAQSRPVDEIVVVDAGPAGGPGSRVAQVGVPGLRHVAASGPRAALWQRGIEETTGDVVVLVDADELLLADAVADHLAAHATNEGPVVSVGDVYVLDDGLEPMDEAFWGPKSSVGHLADGDWLPAGAMALSRAALAAVGPLRDELGDAAIAEWSSAAAGVVALVPTGRHTLARRGIGFDTGDARAQLTVLCTLLEHAGAEAIADQPEEAPALVDVGLRLLRLGDAEGALACFERAESVAGGAGSELAATVRTALAEGGLDLVAPLSVRTVATPAAPTSPVTPSSARPSVTIAIPTFDRARFLGDAIDSALAQTRPADEVLVVDDGSTDGTADVLARYGDAIRVVRQPNQGGPLARNRAIAEATGEWLMWLDSDDVIEPFTLERHLARLSEVPQADVIYGDLDVVDANLRPTRHQAYQDWMGNRPGLVAALFQGNCIPNPSTMLRRSVLIGAGGYHPDFHRAHDYEMFSRLAGSADFAHNGATVLRYRMHDQDALSGTMEGKDLRYELTVVHRMIDRYDLATLIPDAGWDGDRVEAEATARVRVAVRLVQLGDVITGAEHARAAQALRPIPAAQQLVTTLEEALRSGLDGHRPLPVVDLAAGADSLLGAALA
ncbi:MAG: glycosyltransferase family 2 protein [Actinomycetota bacterium]